MEEPFFEDVKITQGKPYFPYVCHIQENGGKPLMASAHWHYRIEILYAVEGSATILLDGQFMAFKKGDMVLISAREVHSIWGEPDTKYVVINFDPEILLSAARSTFETRYILPFTMARESPQKIFTRGEIEPTPLPGMIMAALKENTEQNYGYELAVRTLISQIFLWVLRAWHDRGLRIGTMSFLREKDLERLKSILDLMEQTYMQNLNALEMAARCKMSYSYFSRYFKSAIGMSFTSYLNFIRLAEAEKLLLSTDKTITDIAMTTGFSSASYFISQFRKQKSFSPHQFRMKIGKLREPDSGQ
jgi:AraC-like DNA-binding protein